MCKDHLPGRKSYWLSISFSTSAWCRRDAFSQGSGYCFENKCVDFWVTSFQFGTDRYLFFYNDLPGVSQTVCLSHLPRFHSFKKSANTSASIFFSVSNYLYVRHFLHYKGSLMNMRSMQVFRKCCFRYSSGRSSLWHGDTWAESWNKQEKDIWMNVWGLSWLFPVHRSIYMAYWRYCQEISGTKMEGEW